MASNTSINEILTKNDVLEVVQQFTKDNTFDVQDYSLNLYSEQKLGHMGSHLQLKITIKKMNTEKPEIYTFFVKAIIQDSQTAYDFVNDVFTEELYFFLKVKPLLLKNYKDQTWSPTCYLAKKEFLVMEDLRIKGFEMITNFLDETSLLKSVLETLARFHACSIVAEARLTLLQKKSVSLNKYFPTSMKEKLFVKDKATNALIMNTMELVLAIAESLGRNTKKIRDIFEKLFDVVTPSEKYRNVICHGDLWANNLMFKIAGSRPQCVLIDFQTLRYAPIVLDILQLLYLNTTSNYRKQHEVELIKFYSMVLEETVKNNDETDIATAPTFEEILEAYTNLRFYGVSLATFYLPFTLIDQEKMKEMYSGSDGNTLFSDRTDVTFSYMKQHEPYKKQIEEVVNELADIAEN